MVEMGRLIDMVAGLYSHMLAVSRSSPSLPPLHPSIVAANHWHNASPYSNSYSFFGLGLSGMAEGPFGGAGYYIDQI